MSEEDEPSLMSISSVVSGVTDVATSVSIGVGGVVHSVAAGVGDVVQNMSAGGEGGASWEEEEEEEEGPGVMPATPRNTSLSPTSSMDLLHTDQSPSTDSEVAAEVTAINTELGLSEHHFCKPEESIEGMSVERLEESVEKCKSLILQCDEATSRRRALVHKLIQLRLRLQDVQELAEVVVSSGVLTHMSHHLQPLKPPLTRASKQYCDKCAQIIWGVIHVSYVCSLCEYRCHGRCVDGIIRRCASVRVNDDPSYILRICPEVGLSAQNYKCAECKRLITNKSAWSEPRRCDYTGLYFCPACHWNSRVVLPARVVHNWDFEERTVSRQAKQFLVLMSGRPILHLQDINPHLFKFVEELNTVKKLREDLLVMKQYLGTCRSAQEARMLRQLEERQHFVDNAHMFSLQDLIDVNTGTLMDYLNRVHASFANHIKNECLTCQGKGFICEICDMSEILFPFDGGVVVCGECCTVLHHRCFTSRAASQCPRCLRQHTRRRHDDDEGGAEEKGGGGVGVSAGFLS
ncbi:hypothetical protein Pcinc_029859 [Petrolisthes cinctipes]|uniref:Phorbol-ester/DAG-type domain-containing protein n=1 Tax=Petrolisthes cinctipes TaxID=88211 RepID=A0AAE1K769_PETCI|nr:hypothetical protein Pcinc_029859 [Petrolisthes cinctipes]